jgi:predicted ribosomally synthesized peptide with SipW-like signal peptide
MTTRRMAVTRAIVSVGATLALVAGVTFANLSSTASLTNNTLLQPTCKFRQMVGLVRAQTVFR